MQVLCIADHVQADVACEVCGQTYALYFERKSTQERAEAIRMVEETLARHHASSGATSPHPAGPFNVPEWCGPASASGAALLGGAPLPIAAQAQL